MTLKDLSQQWHQHLHPVEEICVMCLYPGSDSLLHIGVCCKSLASQVLLKKLNEM